MDRTPYYNVRTIVRIMVVVVAVVLKRGGVPPTIAPYSSIAVLLLVAVVLMPHDRLEPTPLSVIVAVIIGAPPGAAQHVEEVGGLIHWEPLLMQFLDLVAIGWAEGVLAVRPPPPPVQSLLLLLVPTFLPIFIQGMATASHNNKKEVNTSKPYAFVHQNSQKLVKGMPVRRTFSHSSTHPLRKLLSKEW